MNRLFGAKSTAPKATLTGAISNVEGRIESIDVKLAKLNAELSTYQQRLGRLRDGPGKNAIKQKALKVLQQRKLYEGQRDTLQQQAWNMEQAGLLQDNAKNAAVTVEAMSATAKELRRSYKKVDVAKIDRIQDELAELAELGNEIQESVAARAYDVPDDVDEAELDAELDALGQEMELELAGAETNAASDSLPAFMVDEAHPPAFIDEPPLDPTRVKESAG